MSASRQMSASGGPTAPDRTVRQHLKFPKTQACQTEDNAVVSPRTRASPAEPEQRRWPVVWLRNLVGFIVAGDCVYLCAGASTREGSTILYHVFPFRSLRVGSRHTTSGLPQNTPGPPVLVNSRTPRFWNKPDNVHRKSSNALSCFPADQHFNTHDKSLDARPTLCQTQ